MNAFPRPPRRWFQFRLKTLLALVASFCVALGVWQAYWTHFASYVKAGPVRGGEPIHVRGQFVQFNGHESTLFVIQARQPHPQYKSGVIYQSVGGRVERSGKWTYRVEIDMAPIDRPGTFELELLPIQRPMIAGKLVVGRKEPTKP